MKHCRDRRVKTFPFSSEPTARRRPPPQRRRSGTDLLNPRGCWCRELPPSDAPGDHFPEPRPTMKRINLIIDLAAFAALTVGIAFCLVQWLTS